MEFLVQFANQASLTQDFDLVLSAAGGGRYFEDNSTSTNTDGAFQTHGEGILKPLLSQSFSSASFAGEYAFVFPGQDTSNKPAALGGVIKANGTDGSLLPGTSDFNDNGTFSSGTLTGTFSGITGNRGGASLTFPIPNGQTTLGFIFYFVSPSDIFFVETDLDTTTFKPTIDRLAGEMVLQNPSTQFGNAVLGGSSVATGVGLNSNGNSDIFGGLLTATTCDGVTPVMLSYEENSGGALSAPSLSGTCTLGASGNGRAAFSFPSQTAAQTRVATAYLTGPGTGFILGSDTAVTTGLLEQQTAAPFSDASVMGSYAMSAPMIVETSQKNVIGQVTSTGTGTLSGVVDEIDPPATGAPSLAQPFTAAFVTLGANGEGTLTTTGTVPAGIPSTADFFLVSLSSFRIVSTDTSDTHPNLLLLDH